MTKLIENEPVMTYQTSVALAVGLHEAMLLQQIHYWIEVNKAKSDSVMIDGRYWTYNTYEEWQKQFPFWTSKTVRNIVKKLRDLGVLIIGNHNRMKSDRTLWYSIDYDRLNEIVSSSQKADEEKSYTSSEKKVPPHVEKSSSAIPYITTDNNTDTIINTVLCSKDKDNIKEYNGASDDARCVFSDDSEGESSVPHIEDDDYPVRDDDHSKPIKLSREYIDYDVLDVVIGKATRMAHISDMDAAKEIRDIIVYFYKEFYRNFGVDHPPLSAKNMSEIVLALYDDDFGLCHCLEAYAPMIDKYFSTDFGEHCDYHLNHFVSGEVRKMQYYSTQYDDTDMDYVRYVLQS